jgi:radical SAM superfamily enzyme YgiQ (UPF0313 family)
MKSGPILLVSCYELGHQPAGLALPMAFLKRVGIEADALDVSVEGFSAEKARSASFVGISVPMHTALRLGVKIAEAIRRINSDCHICFYGLYASLNAAYLLETVADSVIGGEYEAALVELVRSVEKSQSVVASGVNTRANSAGPTLSRLSFPVPERKSLPSLERYARLRMGGQEMLAGYVEASRGCLHHCTHCPIPPVYEGRFFVVPQDVVVEDIRRLVGAGARHITFGDPDFLNGPQHSLRIVRAVHEEFPDLTYDFTAKIEHLLKHRAILPGFAETGCVFVVSAVESLSNVVLEHLDKGHTRDDILAAVHLLRDAGVAMRPSFVAFTPWTTIDDYIDMLEFLERYSLIDHVDPVQFSIRLLVPPGSVLLSQPDTQNWIGELDRESFTYLWRHSDPRMDSLHTQVSTIVENAVSAGEDPAETFYRIL